MEYLKLKWNQYVPPQYRTAAAMFVAATAVIALIFITIKLVAGERTREADAEIVREYWTRNAADNQQYKNCLADATPPATAQDDAITKMWVLQRASDCEHARLDQLQRDQVWLEQLERERNQSR
jgi:hypothetical protein